MGIISTIVIDGLIVTTLFAGVRRATGWSVYNALEPKIPNYMGRLAFRKYLEAGEWCVDKGKSVMEKMTTQGNMPQGATRPPSQTHYGDGFQTPPGRDKNQWGF